MAGGISTRIELDLSQLERFATLAPQEVRGATRTFYQRGLTLMRGNMIDEAIKRFGREQSESRMQTVDPSRPKGAWAASVQGVPDSRGGIAVGPSVKPYAAWVEQGSRAPFGVPRTHRDASFIGHRPVERGAKKSIPSLARVLESVIQGALERATR